MKPAAIKPAALVWRVPLPTDLPTIWRPVVQPTASSSLSFSASFSLAATFVVAAIALPAFALLLPTARAARPMASIFVSMIAALLRRTAHDCHDIRSDEVSLLDGWICHHCCDCFHHALPFIDIAHHVAPHLEVICHHRAEVWSCHTLAVFVGCLKSMDVLAQQILHIAKEVPWHQILQHRFLGKLQLPQQVAVGQNCHAPPELLW